MAFNVQIGIKRMKQANNVGHFLILLFLLTLTMMMIMMMTMMAKLMAYCVPAIVFAC